MPDTICDELERRGIRVSDGAAGDGVFDSRVDDPEGNMIELFPNIDHIRVAGERHCARRSILMRRWRKIRAGLGS